MQGVAERVGSRTAGRRKELEVSRLIGRGGEKKEKKKKNEEVGAFFAASG